METSSLRSLKIMPRNINDIVRSWMRFLVHLLPTYLTDYTAMNFEESNSKKCLYPIKGTSHHADKGLLKMVRLDRSWGVKGPNIVIWIINLLLFFVSKIKFSPRFCKSETKLHAIAACRIFVLHYAQQFKQIHFLQCYVQQKSCVVFRDIFKGIDFFV